MTAWPPADCSRAVYEVPRVPQPELTPIEQRVHIASSRLREGLPVTEEILDELARQPHPDEMYTPAERREMHEVDGIHGLVDAMLEADGNVARDYEVLWSGGHRALRVWVSERVAHYQRRLGERFGPGRVLVEPLRVTDELQTRVIADSELLAQQGIFVTGGGSDPRDGLHITFRSWDAEAGERTLRQRYGDRVVPEYAGAGERQLLPVPFASWLAEDDRLHVFYALGLNGERPLGAQAIEADDAVIVGLRVDATRGWSTLVGGFTPSHATVQLATALGDRVVIDDSANVVRPHWTQVPPSPDPGRRPRGGR